MLTKQQKERWKQLPEKDREEMFRFFMNDLGVSAIGFADFLMENEAQQDERARIILGKMAELSGDSDDRWKLAYEELAAQECIPFALYRTFIVVWGACRQDFSRISF